MNIYELFIQCNRVYKNDDPQGSNAETNEKQQAMKKEQFMLDNIGKEVIFIIKRVRYIYVLDFKNAGSC